MWNALELHILRISDGYHLGKVDRQAGHDYRGGHTSQTKNWRDGYKAGWYGDRCRIHDDDDGL